MKKILIIGLGKSGIAAAVWLLKEGNEVLGFDDKKVKAIPPGMQIVENTACLDWDDIHFVVVSPGIPSDHPLYRKAIEQGIEVIGEAELALRSLYLNAAVAITGTNGKTTVSLLVEHVLKSAGIKACALGNVGEPLSNYVMRCDPEEILVVELSSYQIETLSSRVFDAAVILNITPDHLDRYPDMQAYAETKCAIQKTLKENGTFFIHPSVAKQYSDLLSEPYAVYVDALEDEWILPMHCAGWGKHDKENALAAWALCRIYGISQAHFLSALKTFQKPHHRIEFVCEIDGICYYDDSKGTNIDAVIHAVDAMSGPVILIAGGVDKGASYLPWADKLKKKIKRILVLGQAAEKIERELCLVFEVERVDSLAMAVESARSIAVKGDAVLLSPGCSSYDMFEDYAHRGREFKRLITRGAS